MLKDLRDKIAALGVIGGVFVGIIAASIINLVKLLGFVGSLAFSITFGIMLNFMGSKITFAFFAFGLIFPIVAGRFINFGSAVEEVAASVFDLCLISMVGWVTNFIGSSSLIIGGFTGFIYPTIFLLGSYFSKEKENCDCDESLQNICIKLSIVTVVGTAIGACLGAAIGAIFPNVMLSMWSADLAVTVMGALMLPIEIFMAELVIFPAVDKLEPFFALNKVTVCGGLAEDGPRL